MEFSVEKMMENSFVLVKDDSEYDRFAVRMKSAGFDKMPLRYFGNYPCGLVQCKGDRRGFVFCALSHYVLVNMAKTMGWDHVTIFESDAYPMTDCMSVLGGLLAGGIPDDSDEITFGNLHFIEKYDRYLCNVNGGFGRIRENLWGSQCVTIFSKAYDTWMGNFRKHQGELHSDFFNELVPRCYSTTKSYFIQVKDGLEYPQWLVDKENLRKFPKI